MGILQTQALYTAAGLVSAEAHALQGPRASQSRGLTAEGRVLTKEARRLEYDRPPTSNKIPKRALLKEFGTQARNGLQDLRTQLQLSFSPGENL